MKKQKRGSEKGPNIKPCTFSYAQKTLIATARRQDFPLQAGSSSRVNFFVSLSNRPGSKRPSKQAVPCCTETARNTWGLYLQVSRVSKYCPYAPRPFSWGEGRVISQGVIIQAVCPKARRQPETKALSTQREIPLRLLQGGFSDASRGTLDGICFPWCLTTLSTLANASRYTSVAFPKAYMPVQWINSHSKIFSPS